MTRAEEVELELRRAIAAQKLAIAELEAELDRKAGRPGEASAPPVVKAGKRQVAPKRPPGRP